MVPHFEITTVLFPVLMFRLFNLDIISNNYIFVFLKILMFTLACKEWKSEKCKEQHTEPGNLVCCFVSLVILEPELIQYN